MDGQGTSVRKKKGPPPTGKGVQVKLSMHANLLDPLDEWIGAQPGKKMTRQQAIYLFVKERLGVK